MKPLHRLTAALLSAVCGVAALTAGPAQATPVQVDVFAQANSSSGGLARDTGIDLVAGDRLVSHVDPLDCWAAGGGSRVSNANGLDGQSVAPCLPTANFGLHTQDGESFPFGALVARIGNADWFMLGTSFDAPVAVAGRLFLAYWDSNSGDNSGFVTATLDVNPRPNPAPAPATALLVLGGLLAAGRPRRKRAARA